jgi:SOS-response transcriptional repressor LexA
MRERLLAFIIAYKRAHDGNSPTYREMMAATGLSTTSSVAYHLEKLEAEGVIERPQQVGNTRVIEVVGGRWSPPEELEALRSF